MLTGALALGLAFVLAGCGVEGRPVSAPSAVVAMEPMDYVIDVHHGPSICGDGLRVELGFDGDYRSERTGRVYTEDLCRRTTQGRLDVRLVAELDTLSTAGVDAVVPCLEPPDDFDVFITDMGSGATYTNCGSGTSVLDDRSRVALDAVLDAIADTEET